MPRQLFIRSTITLTSGIALLMIASCAAFMGAEEKEHIGISITPTLSPSETTHPVTISPTFTFSPPTETVTSAPTNVVDSMLPVGITDLFFVNAYDGWLVGPRKDSPSTWQYLIASTQDGGATWNALPMPTQLIGDPDTKTDIGLLFQDPLVGWIYFSQVPSGISGMYSTIDGGRTWKNELTDGFICSMHKSIDGLIWARECKQDESQARLMIAAGASYESWHPASVQLSEEASQLDVYKIILRSENTAWIAYFSPSKTEQGRKSYEFNIISTMDGGINWNDLITPCGPYFAGSAFHIDLVSVGESNLWLGCGEAFGAGSGSKFVYFSSDGGTSWETRFSTESTPDYPDPYSKGGGYYTELDSLSKDFVYMTWRRAVSVILTNDGGATWDFSLLPCSSESSSALFVTPMVGWAYDRIGGEQSCINHTTDGGASWDCVLIPDNMPCENQ